MKHTTLILILLCLGYTAQIMAQSNTIAKLKSKDFLLEKFANKLDLYPMVYTEDFNIQEHFNEYSEKLDKIRQQNKDKINYYMLISPTLLRTNYAIRFNNNAYDEFKQLGVDFLTSPEEQDSIFKILRNTNRQDSVDKVMLRQTILDHDLIVECKITKVDTLPYL